LPIRFASATFPAHKYLIEGPPPCNYGEKILSGPSVEFIYRLVRGEMWFHDGGFAMISQLTQIFRTALETPHFNRWYRAGMLFSMAVSCLIYFSVLFLFQDLTFCSNFSAYDTGLYLDLDMDLTEEDVQIWYFGPDDVGTKSKCPPGLILVSQHSRVPPNRR
jgi:hypothetical protein